MSTTAILLGAASLVGVVLGAYGELRGGPVRVVPVLLLFIVAAAGLLLLVTWRRDIARDPAIVPAAVCAVCTLLYCVALPEFIGLDRFALGRDSSWLSFALAVIAYMLIFALATIPASFVYHGSRTFLHSAFKRLRTKGHNA